MRHTNMQLSSAKFTYARSNVHSLCHTLTRSRAIPAGRMALCITARKRNCFFCFPSCDTHTPLMPYVPNRPMSAGDSGGVRASVHTPSTTAGSKHGNSVLRRSGCAQNNMPRTDIAACHGEAHQ
jgi:hypothetical protein